MAPNNISINENTNEKERKLKVGKMEKVKQPGHEIYYENDAENLKLSTDPNFRHKYIRKMIIIFTVLHVAAIYGLYLTATFKIKLLTFIWGFLLGVLSALGAILGAHRGFSHNAFKLTPFGQILMVIFQTLSGQNNIYWWVRDHRLHHKFVDTDADPYNAKRGFFFSHIGWQLTRRHPAVYEKGRTIDLSDLLENKYIMFQKKYYASLFLLFNVLIPTLVPFYLWNEDFWIAFFTCFAYRYVHVLNATWCINSFAHMIGDRPFDSRISARQSSIVAYLTFGDGWHNYHHVFPWDYSCSEYGFTRDLSTIVLRILEKCGVAYDLKQASSSVVVKHSKGHGDGSLDNHQFRKMKNQFVN